LESKTTATFLRHTTKHIPQDFGAPTKLTLHTTLLISIFLFDLRTLSETSAL